MDVINNKDKLGTATEKLVEMVGERQGLRSLDGGKYGSNNGFDHVFQNTDGSVTILLDSKQMTEAGAKLSPAAAGKTVQMSDEWVEKVLDNLVATSPAAIAIEKALRNGTLVKGVAAIDKSSGKLIILRVQ